MKGYTGTPLYRALAESQHAPVRKMRRGTHQYNRVAAREPAPIRGVVRPQRRRCFHHPPQIRLSADYKSLLPEDRVRRKNTQTQLIQANDIAHRHHRQAAELQNALRLAERLTGSGV